MIDYGKTILFGGLCVILFGSGWYMGYSKYLDYKKAVEIAAKTQEAKVESIQKQHELVTKGISDEFDAKLAAVRNYYKSTSVWNTNGGSKTSGLSTAPNAVDVATAYDLLARQCAETTVQTIALQDWIREQAGIK